MSLWTLGRYCDQLRYLSQGRLGAKPRASLKPDPTNGPYFVLSIPLPLAPS